MVQGCNTVTNSGNYFNNNRVSSVLPASPTGGTILPGKYHQISRTTYTGPGGQMGSIGAPLKTAFLLTATSTGFTMEKVDESASTVGTFRNNYDVSVSGTELDLVQTCPDGTGSSQLQYSVNGDQLSFFDIPGAVIEVHQREP